MSPYASDTHLKSTGEIQEPVHPGAAQTDEEMADAGMVVRGVGAAAVAICE